MASPSGTSSGSSRIGQSQSEEDLQALMNQRKQKRMLSNRESARRSRMRKQKHLDDLTAQVSQLRKENGQILTALGVTTQHYVGVEAENSVLRAQMMELTATLQSLGQILHSMRGIGSGIGDLVQASDSFVRPWNLMGANQPMMMASADTSQLYC
ncbi:ocs element-binding factor 1 [Musa troglodytarum]|uniref:Ocs element-binding factor 1 n=1 Tax=Musa troglodytarum TaxID=320322 RepID=A0A9E7I8K7_9LILI|nr:ocs element-binding factor 1 [Musa troglodytarum]